MSYQYTCAGAVSPLNLYWPEESRYQIGCSVEWEAVGEGAAYSCSDEPAPISGDTSPPGWASSWAGEDTWFLGCNVEFVEEDDPGEGSGLPEGFVPATALEFFSAGFAVVFGFWALGKAVSVVLALVRR